MSTGWPFSKASMAASNPWAKQTNSIVLFFVYFLQVLNTSNNLAHFCYKWVIRNHGLREQDTSLRGISKLACQYSWSGRCLELNAKPTETPGKNSKGFEIQRLWQVWVKISILEQKANGKRHINRVWYINPCLLTEHRQHSYRSLLLVLT